MLPWAALGRLHLTANPSGPKERCVWAEMAYASIPNLRFDLRLLGGNFLNLMFVKRWLRDVYCNLLEPYTLPDKVRYPQAD